MTVWYNIIHNYSRGLDFYSKFSHKSCYSDVIQRYWSKKCPFIITVSNSTDIVDTEKANNGSRRFQTSEKGTKALNKQKSSVK